MTSSLDSWIGRKEEARDTASAFPAAALAATLDRPETDPKPGDALPPCWHWLYFLDAVPAGETGEDGHRRKGGFLPPVDLPRRMWAGSRLDFLAPIRIGDALRRESEILSVAEKSGRSGRLVFVTVRHRVTAERTLAVEEEHDIVYRDLPKPGVPPAASERAVEGPPWRRSLVPDPVMLFRFSALTFNGHRIHYDHPYVTGVEGYPGLIVHGPLQAILLLDLCRRHAGAPVRRFSFRAQQPAFAGKPLSVNGAPSKDQASARLWIADAEGAVAMSGEAAFGSSAPA